jgi:hypothetical protein
VAHVPCAFSVLGGQKMKTTLMSGTTIGHKGRARLIILALAGVACPPPRSAAQQFSDRSAPVRVQTPKGKEPFFPKTSARHFGGLGRGDRQGSNSANAVLLPKVRRGWRHSPPRFAVRPLSPKLCRPDQLFRCGCNPICGFFSVISASQSRDSRQRVAEPGGWSHGQ